MKAFNLILCLGLFVSYSSTKNVDGLRQQINTIISSKQATFGVGVYNIDTGDTLFINGNKSFAMMSVVKFPQALTVLQQVDTGTFKTDMPIHFEQNDLRPNTYSPILNEHHEASFDIPLSEALSYTVSHSDNNVCDKLFEILGGPRHVDDYIHSLGITGISIGTDYANMRTNTIYANQTTPKAMIDLLRKFYNNEVLSQASHDLLWKKFVEASTGANRIKGLLPEGTIVAHKTGTTGIDENGVTAANNDVGIVLLPNGITFAIAVFIKNSSESDETDAKIIAVISRTVYDYFSK
ncbi:class A beta-lactamase, subclass A2 [candidate division KSB1 bacterium]|nr:class A beta-lactamase, subclass A2 [candidate division KSB1 bacterium]